MFAYNFVAAHTAYVYYFLLLHSGNGNGNVLRAANFSLLLQLRVRHFRIATVIILITSTVAEVIQPPPLPIANHPPKKEINFYLTRLSFELASSFGFALCLAF